jgi:hypothetical protein
MRRQRMATAAPFFITGCSGPRAQRFLFFLLLFLPLLAAAGGLAVRAQVEPPASTCLSAVPCADARGCPDLVVDAQVLAESWFLQRRQFSTGDCAVVEGEVKPGRRRLLLFTSNTPNLGPGALVIGDPGAHPEWFEFDTCHGHAHFREDADYRLWTPEGHQQWLALRQANPDVCARDLLAAHPELLEQVLEGHKQGFCVIDLYPSTVPCPYPPDPPRYDWCEDQGLGVCWADEYHWTLSGQWIDVSGLGRGDYVLEVEVNAERFFEESNYSNNAVSVPVQITGRVGR